VPLLCPLAGALLGAWTYQLAVAAQLSLAEEEVEEEQKSEMEPSFVVGPIKGLRESDESGIASIKSSSSPKSQISTVIR